MYFLKGKYRRILRQDARDLVRRVSSKPAILPLADSEVHDIATNTLKKRLSGMVTEAASEIPRNVSENAAFGLARAMASRAYEIELLNALKKDAKSTNVRMLAETLGVKPKDMNSVLEESRRRLGLTKKAESLSARGLALLPRAVKQRGLYNLRYAKRMADAEKLMAEYNASLNGFYAGIRTAKKRRELQ